MWCLFACFAAGAVEPLRLWYNLPATQSPYVKIRCKNFILGGEHDIWQQNTLPIGNGFIGATVYGEISSERLVFNEKTLWIGGPSSSRPNYNGGNNKEKGQNGQTWRHIQELFAQGKDSEASNECENLIGDSDGYGSYVQWGDLYFDFGISKSLTSNYVRDLDLDKGIANVDFTYLSANWHREFFVNYPHNVLVAKFTVDSGKTLSVDCRFPSCHSEAGYSIDGADLVVSGALKDNQMRFNGRMRVITDGTVKAEGKIISVSDATDVVVLVAAATDYKMVHPNYRSGEGDDELNARVKKIIDDAAALGFQQLKDEHLKDYQGLFGRVKLDIGQTLPTITTYNLLENYRKGKGTDSENRYLEVLLYQYGRYLTIGASREKNLLPSNLQGIWNDRISDVPWSSDYHMNVNLQMNYWPTYMGNLEECAIPLIDYVDGLRIPGRITAEIYTGIASTTEHPENGFMAHTQNTPFGWTCPGWSFSWGWSPAAVAWILHNVYEYYEYTMDETVLKERIYPMLREETIFYDQMMVIDGRTGRLISSPTYSPEQGPRTNGNAYEQELIWQLYNDTVTAATILGVDQDLIPKWKENMTRMKPIEIGYSGQIKEWYTETTLGSIGDKGHRHMSHLLGFYPLNVISSDNDEWLDAVKISLVDRGDTSTGWGMGQRINTWARTGDGNHAHVLIQNLFKNGIYPNLWDTHPPFQIDGNYGATSGITEMIMQSHRGCIALLPSLPDVWATGSVDGLIARGNFQISMSWKDKSLTDLSIVSRAGAKCSVRYQGIATSLVKTASGADVSYTVINRDQITFETTKGETYVFSNIQPKEAVESGPVNVYCARIAESIVQIDWDALEGASSYTIWRQTDDGPFVEVGTSNECSFTDNWADSGVTHYKVSAVKNGKQTALSRSRVVADVRGTGLIDDRNESFLYVGNWFPYDHEEHWGGTIHYIESTSGGEFIQTGFIGTGVVFISPTNKAYSSVDFYVDSVKVNEEPYSLYGDDLKRVETKVIDGLEYKYHILRIVATGDKTHGKGKLEFDAIRVYDQPIAHIRTPIEMVSGNMFNRAVARVMQKFGMKLSAPQLIIAMHLIN